MLARQQIVSTAVVTCNDFVITDDVTRVILMAGTSGGYINANYVNMEIPGSGIINRYIATQGMQCNTYTVYTVCDIVSNRYGVHSTLDIV
jgi:protein tyrosine phosphatase